MAWKGYLLLASVASLAAGEQSWKDKAVPEWTESDAKQILSESPWVKSVTGKFNRPSNARLGQRGGIGVGGMGFPRAGGRGGMGRGDRQPSPDSGPQRTSPTLTVRWESALPVQEAHLKIHDENAPSVDEDYYTVAVFGLPARMGGGDPKDLENRWKHGAQLKREGKKAIQSTEARVLPRDDGLMLLFLFPRSQEITSGDKRMEFDVHLDALELTADFDLTEMTYAGKLEL